MSSCDTCAAWSRSSTPAASPTPPPSSGVSQAAVSRTLAALEDALGVRLLRRTSRSVVPTAAGERVLARARQVLAEVDDLVREAPGGHARLRIGHAWAAMGEHTVEFQRRWAARHPDVAAAPGPHQLADRRARRGRVRPGRRPHSAGRPRRPVGSPAPSSASSRGTARWPPTTRWPGADTCALGDLTRPRPGRRPAHRNDHPRSLAARGPPRRRGHPRRRRLAGRDRHRPLRRRHRREHARPSTGATASCSAASATPRPSPCGSSGGATTRTRPPATWWGFSSSCTAGDGLRSFSRVGRHAGGDGAREPRDRRGVAPARRRTRPARRHPAVAARVGCGDAGRLDRHRRGVPALAGRRAGGDRRAGRPRGPRLGRRARAERGDDPAGPAAHLGVRPAGLLRPRLRLAPARAGLADPGEG